MKEVVFVIVVVGFTKERRGIHVRHHSNKVKIVVLTHVTEM